MSKNASKQRRRLKKTGCPETITFEGVKYRLRTGSGKTVFYASSPSDKGHKNKKLFGGPYDDMNGILDCLGEKYLVSIDNEGGLLERIRDTEGNSLFGGPFGSAHFIIEIMNNPYLRAQKTKDGPEGIYAKDGNVAYGGEFVSTARLWNAGDKVFAVGKHVDDGKLLVYNIDGDVCFSGEKKLIRGDGIFCGTPFVTAMDFTGEEWNYTELGERFRSLKDFMARDYRQTLVSNGLWNHFCDAYDTIHGVLGNFAMANQDVYVKFDDTIMDMLGKYRNQPAILTNQLGALFRGIKKVRDKPEYLFEAMRWAA